MAAWNADGKSSTVKNPPSPLRARPQASFFCQMPEAGISPILWLNGLSLVLQANQKEVQGTLEPPGRLPSFCSGPVHSFPHLSAFFGSAHSCGGPPHLSLPSFLQTLSLFFQSALIFFALHTFAGFRLDSTSILSELLALDDSGLDQALLFSRRIFASSPIVFPSRAVVTIATPARQTRHHELRHSALTRPCVFLYARLPASSRSKSSTRS